MQPTSEQPTDSPVTNVGVEIIKNGTKINATLGAYEKTFSFTARTVSENRNNTGEYITEIPNRDSIGIMLLIAALEGDKLIVKTNFGTISINNSAIQAIRALTGNTLRLVIEKSSFRVALLNSSNREVNYNNPANPFTITLPYTLSRGQQRRVSEKQIYCQ